jgi:hypothetical protein
MRKACLIATVLIIVVGMLLSLASASAQTVVYYNVATDDVFPEREDVDASVNVNCTVVYNCTDGAIEPDKTSTYSVEATPGSGTLTVNYTVDRPLLKRSGSPSVPINPEWLIGDSPPITVYDDGTVKITVAIHGQIVGNVSLTGNGSVTPTAVVWTVWETKNITVSASPNAQIGQKISIQMATKYRVYFTVNVDLVGIEVLTKDSPSKEVSGVPPIQSEITVVPEMPVWGLLLAVTLASFTVSVSKKISRKRLKQQFNGTSYDRCHSGERRQVHTLLH